VSQALGTGLCSGWGGMDIGASVLGEIKMEGRGTYN